MSVEIERYDSYKDSGIEWLGEIPSHWCVEKLKYYGKFVSGIEIDSKKLNDESNGIQYLRTNDINTESSIRKDKVYFNGEIDSEYIKSRDEFVICFDGFNSVLGRGTLGLFTNSGEGIMCSKINKIKATKDCMIDRYMMYSAGMESNLHLIVANSRGAIAKHAGHAKREMLTVIPPKEEQELITKYIDRKVSAIDSVIAKKQQLIDNLKLSKQALITETVTKGLDDTVPMKDSGVAWIGEISRDFEITKFKHMGKSIGGLTYSPKDVVDSSFENAYLVLRSSNIKDSKLVLEDNVFVNKKISNKLKISDGDILICATNGSAKLVGKCTYIEKSGINHTFGSFMKVYRAYVKSYSKYISYYMQSDLFRAQLKDCETPTINQITANQINNMVIIKPSEDDVKCIVDYLDKKVGEFDRLISLQEQSIENLKLTKQKLITEVVTGKLKVC